MNLNGQVDEMELGLQDSTVECQSIGLIGILALKIPSYFFRLNFHGYHGYHGYHGDAVIITEDKSAFICK